MAPTSNRIWHIKFASALQVKFKAFRLLDRHKTGYFKKNSTKLLNKNTIYKMVSLSYFFEQSVGFKIQLLEKNSKIAYHNL